ncbi:hypothetical protein TNCV_4466961 [Trichonephila clavipes]|nr:hypothetical protein TNCV_4466961 [Trichonephila clavipes]
MHGSGVNIPFHSVKFPPILLRWAPHNISYWGAADQSDNHFRDIRRVRAFARSEPKDVSSDYVEQEASKGAFIQALYAKSSLYRLAYKAWNGPQNLTTWTLLAQAVDVMPRNGPIPCFKFPTYAPSV